MVITQGQLIEVVNEYIDTDIMAHCNKLSSLEQLMFGIKVGVIKQSVPQMLDNYFSKPEMKLVGVMTDEGINLDLIYNAATDTMKRLGTVEYAKFKFNQSDIDKLYEIAKRKRGV